MLRFPTKGEYEKRVSQALFSISEICQREQINRRDRCLMGFQVLLLKHYFHHGSSIISQSFGSHTLNLSTASRQGAVFEAYLIFLQEIKAVIEHFASKGKFEPIDFDSVCAHSALKFISLSEKNIIQEQLSNEKDI